MICVVRLGDTTSRSRSLTNWTAATEEEGGSIQDIVAKESVG